MQQIHLHNTNAFTAPPRRLGLIVPSSNVTMETEIPRFLRARERQQPKEPFTTHSSRVRMKKVTPSELKAMNEQAGRAALELADAGVDAILYACLVAVMVEGTGAHLTTEERLEALLREHGAGIPVISSAGALVRTLKEKNLRRVALLTPYLPVLTETVCGYIQSEDIEVVSACSRAVEDNRLVGRLAARDLVDMAADISAPVDAIVLSACVQMPSADVIAEVEGLTGLPVVTAAAATLYQALKSLGLEPEIPGYGSLLAGGLAAG